MHTSGGRHLHWTQAVCAAHINVSVACEEHNMNTRQCHRHTSFLHHNKLITDLDAAEERPYSAGVMSGSTIPDRALRALKGSGISLAQLQHFHGAPRLHQQQMCSSARFLCALKGEKTKIWCAQAPTVAILVLAICKNLEIRSRQSCRKN